MLEKHAALLVVPTVLAAGACRQGPSPHAGSGGTANAQENPGVSSTRDVETDHGAVRGVLEGQSFAFKGIPYAAPPVGALRFAPPADAPTWSSPRDASDWGACCPQVGGGGVDGQEDCLTLNVWAPAAPNGPRPVLVFLHGGGNAQGCSSHQAFGQRTYQGDVLASTRDVIVVTLNYRIGVLGFLAHVALGAESTNLGLRDQIAALKWVQKNVAAFGGDPKKVLIFGESAGAEDTCALVASPRSKGLFSRALMESATCPQRDQGMAHDQSAEIASRVGCSTGDVAACLRAKPFDALVKSAPNANLFEKGIQYGPVVDGDILIEDPLVTIEKGGHNHVPFVIGDNSSETLFWVRDAPIPDEADYRRRVEEFLGETAASRVLARYPVASFASAKDAYVAATTDAVFVCPGRALARAMAKGQTEPVYRYFFAHALNTRSRSKDSGAVHGLELLFVFGHLAPNGYRPTPAEEALFSAIEDYWTRFAVAGDPNGTGHPSWQPYDAAGDDTMILDDTPRMGTGLHAGNCDFWDAQRKNRASGIPAR